MARRAGLNFASNYPQNLPRVNGGRAPVSCRASAVRRRVRRGRPVSGGAPGASLLAFRKGVGYTPGASSQAGFTGAVQTRFESRQDSISHPAETRRFFCSVAGNGSAIVDEMFEAVDGRVGRAFCTLSTRIEAVRRCLRESRNVRPEGDAWSARRDLCGRRRCHSRAARVCSRTARPNGSTEFQVNSSNRFSARAEVAHANAGQPLPWQREARFRPATAEQSFVPAHTSLRRTLNPNHLIFHTHPTPLLRHRRRRFRREVLNACARY